MSNRTSEIRTNTATRRGLLLALAAAPAMWATGCAITGGQSSASPADKRRQIDSGVDATLSRLYSTVKGSQELANKSRGMLVFPQVLAAGLVVGGEYGEGALRVGGRNTAYYRTASGSFGFQAGAQSKAFVLFFMTQEALDRFRNSSGWTAGVDGSVALLKLGANGELDTNNFRQDVAAIAMTNAGLMYNLTIEGTKITRMDI